MSGIGCRSRKAAANPCFQPFAMDDDPRAYALRLLAQRSYTTGDLRRKLKRKRFSVDESESALTRLTESGLLNDAEFALRFARQKLSGSGSSAKRIRQLLQRKGIAGNVAEAAIARTVEETGMDLSEALERVARRRLAISNDLDPEVRRRRLFAFLARRGYDLDDIYKVIDRVLANSPAQP